MKRFSTILSVLIILGTVYWSFSDLKPQLETQKNRTTVDFSLENALFHLKKISEKSHHVGTNAHKNVQNYLIDELNKLGLETQIQTQTAINQKWFAATTAENIMARIKGSGNGKALVLLSHYDSNPHSSKGASDAGSGVVTILEGVRAFLAANKTPKNDIIILFTDAEELGLLGAQAFVDEHAWVKDVGLILNFEARGSGGPSYMLMETNGKNSKLLSEFLAAKPNYPAANSLMYSVYKKLPNDTDLTVFRKDANINGYNFAFIGDHFDYHTAQDSYERLDRETLLHQADYLTTTLNYFSNSNIDDLNSEKDYVYVNFPFSKILSYPFSWVIPILILAQVLFIILLVFGVALNKLTIKGSLKGLFPFIIGLILCTGGSYLLWNLLLVVHPHYLDMLHGFTYNGYIYIAAFTFLNLWILQKVYFYFKKQEKPTDLIVGPILIWIIINFLISGSLKGAGFFIIPVFGALFILAVSIFTNLEMRSKRILFTLISIPTIYIFAPLIKMFPVGLGLKTIFILGFLVALLFGIIVLTFYQKKAKWLIKLTGLMAIGFFGYATYNSGFSIDNKKPNSIVYIQNTDENTAYYGTYNTSLDSYTKQIFDENDPKGSIKSAETKSKYNTRFKYYKKIASKNMASSNIAVDLDTIIANKRFLEIVVTPQRKVHKLEFVTNTKITLQQFKVNDALVNKGKNYVVNKGSFLVYHVANTDEEITLSFSIDTDQDLDIFLNEISYDLLTNPNFKITPRTEEMMPMPFVTNDAIIITKKIKV